ncbi:EAL domain-containing protein [Pseudoalteromonas piscicida]|uniref:Diguanylate cyclase n=1 Tax=Pseudoalteromonas piscicida TaxID=43662 RepID=A0A2A5JRZ8_PSEO7|nr:EAL domain-containing protein [Pseudoalteromonas piscicida]PCK32176.1 diguanylate cyclase [Pseudoalteromonas piscicida]
MWLSIVRYATLMLATIYGVLAIAATTAVEHAPEATVVKPTLSVGYGDASRANFSPIEGAVLIPKGVDVWLRVSGFSDGQGTDLVLSVERPSLGTVEFFMQSDDGSLLVLDEQSISASLSHFSPHLLLHGDYGDNPIFVRIQSPYASVSKTDILPYETYIEETNVHLFLTGIFLGTICLLSVFMLSTGMISRRASLLSVGGYLLSLALLYITHKGLADVFLDHENGSRFVHYSGSFVCFALGFCLLFFHHFLTKNRLSRNLRVGIKVTANIYLLSGVIVAFARADLPFALQSIMVIGAIALSAAILAGQDKDSRKEVYFCCAIWSPMVAILIGFAASQLIRPSEYISIVNHALVSLHLLFLLLFVVWHDAEKRRMYIHYSEFDKETALPNKFALFGALARLEEQHKAHTLLLFKPLILPSIRLSFGLTFANQHISKLFKEVSEQINTYGSAAVANKGETPIYRLEDQVFAIVLDGKIEVSQVEQYVCILSSVFEEGIGYKDTKIVDSLEVGVANYPMHAKTMEKLVQRALQALNTKSQNGQRWHLFDAESSISTERQLKLTSFLKSAVEHEQFSLFFQPQVDLRTGRVFGSEVLLRWLHPELGYIPPDEFIPIAESSGQIYEITEWVMEHALHYQAEITKLLPEHVISINVSGRDLNRRELSVQLITLINELSLAPSQIMIEITESVTIGKEAELKGVLDDFRSIGVKVAIDDFGTGYSSLAYLSKLGFDELKIDKSFVMDIETSKSNQTICKATCDMAHSLGSKVVAEGVEDINSYIRLQAYGCDFAQGYFISRPLPFVEFKSWLDKVNSTSDIKSFLVR